MPSATRQLNRNTLNDDFRDTYRVSPKMVAQLVRVDSFVLPNMLRLPRPRIDGYRTADGKWSYTPQYLKWFIGEFIAGWKPKKGGPLYRPIPCAVRDVVVGRGLESFGCKDEADLIQDSIIYAMDAASIHDPARSGLCDFVVDRIKKRLHDDADAQCTEKRHGRTVPITADIEDEISGGSFREISNDRVIIENVLNALDDQDRAVCGMLMDGLTTVEIAVEFGVKVDAYRLCEVCGPPLARAV